VLEELNGETMQNLWQATTCRHECQSFTSPHQEAAVAKLTAGKGCCRRRSRAAHSLHELSQGR